jgi:adenylate kinase
MLIILLGKPMSGKGTQAKILSKTLHLPHISTGDLLREEVENGTDLGKEAKEYMDKGLLLPDDKIIELFEKRLPKEGAILDGFPRTIQQAKALDKIVSIDLAIMVECSDEIVIKRTVARKMCKECGFIFGLDFPSTKENICDKCGGELYVRVDDNEETIKSRLEVYNELTAPLKEFYLKKGVYWEVNGEKPVSEVQKEMCIKIKSLEK